MVDTMVDAMVGVVVVAMQWLIQWLMQSNGSGAPIVIQNCVGPKKVQYLLPSIAVLAQKRYSTSYLLSLCWPKKGTVPLTFCHCVGPKKVQYLLPSIIVLAQKGTVPLTFEHCAGPKKVQYLLPSIVAPRCGLFLQWYTVHDGVYHTALG